MLQHLHQNPQPPSRVVILGAAGFVGHALAQRLKTAGVNFLPLTRRELDLSDIDAAQKLAAMLQPDDVVVAIAAKAPCKTPRMLLDNMTIATVMVEALVQSPVAHVINVSSDAVYPDEPVPLTEAIPAAPGSLHGVMHLAREIAFISSIKSPLAFLRPTLLYGAADPHNGYGPNQFRRLANAGKDITLFGEGEERRDHVLIDDVAEIIFRTIMMRSTGALNIATGEVHSFGDIARKVVALAPNKIAIKSSPRSGPMPHNGYRPFDIAACRAAFPDFRYTSIDDGLAKAQRDMAQEAGHG
jgi:nucleoside-diphosphate-sugar epimerase